MPMTGLLLASTTVPPTPAQLHASSGWITVLSTWVNDPLNGALAFVGVALGRAVLVGGTSENGVFVGNGVMVGRGVLLGVTCRVGLTGTTVGAAPPTPAADEADVSCCATGSATGPSCEH